MRTSEHRNGNPRGAGSELISSQHRNCHEESQNHRNLRNNPSANTDIAFLTVLSLRARHISTSDATGPSSLGDPPWAEIHFKLSQLF